MTQAALRLLPERLVDVAGDPSARARDRRCWAARASRPRPALLARRLGEPYDLVGPAVQGVHGHHVAWRFDRCPTYYGHGDHVLQLLQLLGQRIRVSRGYGYFDRSMHVPLVVGICLDRGFPSKVDGLDYPSLAHLRVSIHPSAPLVPRATPSGTSRLARLLAPLAACARP